MMTFHKKVKCCVIVMVLYSTSILGTIILEITDAGGSAVNYTFSGSTTYSDTNTIDPAFSSSILLPGNNGWQGYASSEPFLSAFDVYLGSATGQRSITGAIQVLVDGTPVNHPNNPGEGSFVVQLSPSINALTFQETVNDTFRYPALTGGEEISVTGTGVINIGSGTFADNWDVGTHSYTDPDGLQYQVNVGTAAVPEPSTYVLLSLLGFGFLLYRRREKKLH